MIRDADKIASVSLFNIHKIVNSNSKMYFFNRDSNDRKSI